MKTLLIIPLSLIFTLSFSQTKEKTKQELLASIYQNNKKVINYDKSFVSDDRLFYESIQGTNAILLTDEELIKQTLQNYITGSSYNKRGLIKNAFAKNATLYLTGKDGFKRYTPEEYADFFKKGTAGEFNGRDGKIVSVKIVKDIATAKVEIAGPKCKWVYVDLFLLKKIEGSWKIISKTATRIDETKNN
ncbi:nuclear transport factor 2 family protein [uncultured Tenacibaculum sp.]|uniref:nuclear transport factor 2 family protein n=1 Tax=uncultured Tenacibaculum sp. TaxID=174713 RepID=UPI00260D8FD5|nr:nuclear transport factor 2 family protein [uncultured Tenacibaculum sp.]